MIEACLNEVRARVRRACEACGRDPSEVELLPVCKRQPEAKVREAHRLGVRVFAENRVQELVTKAVDLSDLDLSWHMIGSLQTNKVKQLLRVPRLGMLQSVDRPALVEALQNYLAGSELRLPVLLQVNATGEEQKHGVRPEDAVALLGLAQKGAPNLDVKGLMAMGPLSGDPSPVFERVAALREDLCQRGGLPLPVLSLGMTGDMEPAIAAGSTMVRVGTGIFGERS